MESNPLSGYDENALIAELERREAQRKQRAVVALNECSFEEAREAIGACVHELSLTTMRNPTGGR